jgi:hypothetical protein
MHGRRRESQVLLAAWRVWPWECRPCQCDIARGLAYILSELTEANVLIAYGSCFGTPPSPKLKRFSLINGIKFVSPRSPYPALYVFPIVFWQQSPHTSQVSRTTRMAACRRTVLGVRRHLPGLQRPDVYKGVLCHSAVGFRPDIWTTQLADV